MTVPLGTLVYAPPLDEGGRVRGGVVLGVTPAGRYVCLDPGAPGLKIRNVSIEDVRIVQPEADPVRDARLARLVVADLALVMARRQLDNATLTRTEREMVGWLGVLASPR